jgi:hypothetical protein
MLSIRISKEKNKAQGHWLSLPADSEERLKVLRRLEKEELIGTTVAICITGVKSSIANLNQYIHEHDSLEQLNILGAKLEKMSDMNAAIFSAALDMETVNGLEDVIRIANTLRNYELFPEITTPKELGVYLVESGKFEIPESAWPYLDYERMAVEYESNNAGAYTRLGYVVKTGGNDEQVIAGEKQTFKFFSLLFVKTYSSYEYGECGANDMPECKTSHCSNNKRQIITNNSIEFIAN